MPAHPLIATPLTRRRLLQLVGVGAGAAALAACAPTGGASAPSAVPATSGAPKTDFSFASWSLTEEAAAGPIKDLLGQYAAANEVEITQVSYPFNEYISQLTLQVKGGQFTGAAHVDVAWLASLAALGRLQDLGALARQADYTEAGLTAAQFDGVQYGLPWNIGAIGLIGNQELLDKAGIGTFPTTIDDFTAALGKLKGLGGGLIPYAASTKAAQLKDILIWMQTFGCSLVEDGTVTIGDDASIEAATWYKSLYERGLIAADVDRFDARSLFAQGRTALYDDAIVGRDSVITESPDKNLESKLVALPRPVVAQGDTPRALVWGGAIVVVDGEGAGTAADFAQWMTSDVDVAAQYFRARGLPPTTTTALALPEVAADVFSTQFGERITATATTNPFWLHPQYAQIESAIAEQVQAVLVGSSDPKSAMQKAGETAQGLVG